MIQTPPQDSVSDVKRDWSIEARELVQWWDTGVLPRGVIAARADDPSAPWADSDGYSPRQAEQEYVTALVRHVAALAVPIIKIGEDARTYADGVEDAAKVMDERAAMRARLYEERPAAINAFKSVEAEEGAAAIRRLSTSTDKGVR